jgi:hypothetical protein
MEFDNQGNNIMNIYDAFGCIWNHLDHQKVGWKFALSRSHVFSSVFSSPSSAWSLELLCGSPLQLVMRFVV